MKERSIAFPLMVFSYKNDVTALLFQSFCSTLTVTSGFYATMVLHLYTLEVQIQCFDRQSSSFVWRSAKNPRKYFLQQSGINWTSDLIFHMNITALMLNVTALTNAMPIRFFIDDTVEQIISSLDCQVMKC